MFCSYKTFRGLKSDNMKTQNWLRVVADQKNPPAKDIFCRPKCILGVSLVLSD